MSSLFRFYKFNDENVEAIRESFIYLFSAKKWEDDSEFKFKIDIGTDEEYKLFLSEKLREEMNLPEGTAEYSKFRMRRAERLNRHGQLIYLDTPIELDLLVNILFEEAKSSNGIKEREELIKNMFFDKTGICCFTTDEKTLIEPLHWDSFAGYGQGFCVQYDLEMLSTYFLDTKTGIAMDYIKYYGEEIPILKNSYRKNLEEVTKNYHEIFFSLTQTLKDEKEFRLAKVFRFQLEDIDVRRKQPIPRESILSLTIGLSMSSVNEEKLLKITRMNLPNMKLFKIGEQHGILYKYPIK